MSSQNIVISMLKSGKTVFNLQALNVICADCTKQSLVNSLNYFKNKGTIMSPRGGIYTLDSKYSKEEMACSLFWPSYISLDYVLAKAGIIYQYSSVITCISYLSRSLTIDKQEYSYRKIKPSALYLNKGIMNLNGIAIASPERALVDSLYLFPKNTYFDNLNSINKNLVIEIGAIYNDKSLIERIKKIISYE